MARIRHLRLALAGVLLVCLLLVGKLTGLADHLSTAAVRDAMHAAGAWGGLLFLGAFCLGELVHIPGLLFVAAAVLAYGPALGGGLAAIGALLSVSVSLVVVRAVGGTPLAEIRWPPARRILRHLDERPVRTVAVLRLLLWMAPQLNAVLALSSVRFRDYLLGSALGLALPLTLFVLLFDRLFR